MIDPEWVCLKTSAYGSSASVRPRGLLKADQLGPVPAPQDWAHTVTRHMRGSSEMELSGKSLNLGPLNTNEYKSFASILCRHDHKTTSAMRIAHSIP